MVFPTKPIHGPHRITHLKPGYGSDQSHPPFRDGKILLGVWIHNPFHSRMCCVRRYSPYSATAFPDVDWDAITRGQYEDDIEPMEVDLSPFSSTPVPPARLIEPPAQVTQERSLPPLSTNNDVDMVGNVPAEPHVDQVSHSAIFQLFD
jgi:hypothetical protein